ncbi:MAG: aminoacyl-tRNA hydrolase [Ignavibacteriae bacterium]|nr:aminoacyl-tRNA hydrolase [Ignavibacteria bacterium]MBI3365222.1 aminoacyl-tRNA hydrolase [Ignavibacteriota bacterium]
MCPDDTGAKFIIGLGNPGSEYDGTRHNIGFRVIDAVAEALNIDLHSGPGEYMVGSKSLRTQDLVLVKPLTYMNNSGIATHEIVAQYNLLLRQILVVVDDFHLPLGTLRLRIKGSDGGHNGLYSIIYHLQSEDFPRMRCGIGGETMPGNKKEMARYVLTPFEKGERDVVQKMIERARDAVLVAATESIKAAVNRFSGSEV